MTTRAVCPVCERCGSERASYDYDAQAYACGLCLVKLQAAERLRKAGGLRKREEAISASLVGCP